MLILNSKYIFYATAGFESAPNAKPFVGFLHVWLNGKRCTFFFTTGERPRTPTIFFLTEAVMAVIGKESAGVAGEDLPNQTDSTMMAIANTT